jgi:hypothetical protein
MQTSKELQHSLDIGSHINAQVQWARATATDVK